MQVRDAGRGRHKGTDERRALEAGARAQQGAGRCARAGARSFAAAAACARAAAARLVRTPAYITSTTLSTPRSTTSHV